MVMDPFTRRIRRIRNEEAEERDRSFPLEAPVSIFVNAALLATVSATPALLDELALGFLFTERIVSGPEDVLEIASQADRRRGQVWVTLKGGLRPPDAATILSGCGRGVSFLCASDLDALPRVEGGATLAASGIRKGMKALREGAEAYRAGGGIHSAACWVDGRIASEAEDIGRHNAADKALGILLRRGQSPRGAALLTTGRISSDLAVKAAVAGCPAVASLTGATSLACEAAERLGLALVCYVRGDRMDVCTHPERIAAD
jgi:FdhD protein